MCKLCLRDGIRLPHCLNTTRGPSSSPSPPRAPRPAESATPPRGGIASVPASLRSASASRLPTEPGTPAGRPTAPTGRSAGPTERSATPIAGSSGTAAGATLAREASRASGKSSSSHESTVSTATDDSLKSLNTLANIISGNLHIVSALADELRAWAKSPDSASYAEKQMGNRDDWPAEVQTAYGKYKAAVDKHREAQASYNDYMAAIGHRTTDPEVFLRRAELAIGWGQAACKGATRRMVFIKSLGRYAYKDVPSVLRHIDQGMDCVNSSRTAVERARSSIKSIFVALGRNVPDDEFFN